MGEIKSSAANLTNVIPKYSWYSPIFFNICSKAIMMGLFCSYFQEVQHLFFQILQFILKQHKELPPGQVCRDMYIFYNTIYDISILFSLLTYNCSFIHLELSTHCQGIPYSLPVSVTLIMKRCLRKSLMILCFLSQPSSFWTIFLLPQNFSPFPPK